MVDDTPSSAVASSSKKGRLIPSSFRKAGNLTSDQQTRLLRIQAAKNHVQDWETLELINYCLLNNDFDNILGILYEYAKCLDRLERYFDIINEIITQLQESIQTAKILVISFDDIIKSIVQAIKTILTTVCSLRRIQGTPTSLYENNSKVIISPNVSDSKSIFKFIENVGQHLEKYCIKYEVDLSALSSEQLTYIFAATSKVNPQCNNKIIANKASNELRDLINKVVSAELKINAFWEKVDKLDSLKYPTLKMKMNTNSTCPSSLQFFFNDLSNYESLIDKLSSETVPLTENPPLTIPLLNANSVKSPIVSSKSSKAPPSKKVTKDTPDAGKKKESSTLPPAGKSQKQPTPKKQPAIVKGKIESSTPKKIPIAENIKKKSTKVSTDVQVSATPDKSSTSTAAVKPNEQKDDPPDSSSSSDDDDANDNVKSTNQNITKVPRHRSVSIAVMERADSFAISTKLEDYSKKRRSTVVGSIAVDNKKEPQLKRASSVRLSQIPNFDPNFLKRADSQRSVQDILQTSVPFNQSRRNSSAKSLKSVSDVSSDDYDDLPYEEVDPEPIKTNYTSSTFDAGSMNSSFNYDAYDKTSNYYSTPEASPARTRAQSYEVNNRARAQSIDKINRARTTSDDFGSPYKQHKRQVSKTQELFSSLSSLLSPYLPGASKAESQVIHLALRDLESSGHTSGSVLVEMAARKIAIWWSFVGPRQKLRRRMVIRNMCIEVINMCAYRAVSKSVSKRKRRFRWLLNHAALQIQKCLRAFMRKKYQGKNLIPKISMAPFNRRRVNSGERSRSPLPATPEVLMQRKYSEVWPGSGNKPESASSGSGATVNSGKSSDSGGKKTNSTADDKSSRNRLRTSSGEDGSVGRVRRNSGRIRTHSERTTQNGLMSYNWLNKSPGTRAWYGAILMQKVIRKYLAVVRVDKIFSTYDTVERDRNSHYQGSIWSRRHKVHYSNTVRKKLTAAVITIQRVVRGKLARMRSFHIVKAGVLLNRKLNEFKSLKQLRMRLRRIERPLIIKLDNIYNIPNGTFRSDNVNIVVSIWWSPLLHIVSELDFGTIIEGKKPQVQLIFENINIMKQTPELLQKMDTYLETDSAIATEKKQYDRENLSKKKKPTIISLPSINHRPSIVNAANNNVSAGSANAAGLAGGSANVGGSHMRLGSIMSTLEAVDDNESDSDGTSTDEGSQSTDLPKKSRHRSSFLLNRFEGIRKSSRSFIPSIRHSLHGFFNPSKRRSVVEAHDMSPTCLDLQGKTIRVPGCHGNSVVKVEIYDDDRKVGNKVFFLSKHGGWLFWGGKYSEEVKLTGASRLDGSGSRRMSVSSIKPKINFVVKSGEALHSKAAQAIYVKVRGTGPAKLATRTKGLDLSFFEKKFPFYISLNYEDGLGLYHKKTNLEPFYVVPAKDIMSIRLEQGQWVDGGSTLQDSHEIILNTNTYDEIVIRLDSVGNRVRWIEVFENILERNKAAILKFQHQNTIYSNFTKLGKLFDKSPKNQGPVVRRLRGGLQ